MHQVQTASKFLEGKPIKDSLTVLVTPFLNDHVPLVNLSYFQSARDKSHQIWTVLLEEEFIPHSSSVIVKSQPHDHENLRVFIYG